MKSFSDQKTSAESLKLLHTPFDVGTGKGPSNVFELKEDIGGISLPQSLVFKPKRKGKNTKRLNMSEEKSATLESRPAVRRKIWKPSLNSSVIDTQITNACRTLARASILREGGFCQFWTQQSREILERLLLPTKIDCAGSDLSLSSGSSNLMEGKSWFSTTRLVPPNKNSSRIFSQSLQSLVPGSTVCEVTHSRESLGIREKLDRGSNTGKKYKTIQMRFYPNKDQEKRLFADCARAKWYYNACVQLFDCQEFADKIRLAKDRGESCPSITRNEIRNRLAWHKYREIKEGNVIICELYFNDECKVEQLAKAELKIRQAAEKLAKREAKKLEKAKQKEEMKHMSKSKKEAYKNLIAARELIEKEEAKERAKAIRKANGNKAKTARTYPCPKWMEDCYGARISGKTRERIIRGVCANFCSNINSAASNLYNGNISTFDLKRKRSKDVHEFLSFDDGLYPAYIKRLDGCYAYRLPAEYAKSQKLSRRTNITLRELLLEHDKTPVTIVYDKQTKEWLLNLPVERDWFPPHDVRSENQGSKTLNGEAVGLDPGVRKFLTGFSTQGEVFTIGQGASSHLVEIIIKIGKRLKELAGLRKLKSLSDDGLKLQQTLLKEKFLLWRRLKNLVKDMHWKSANYLVRNYQYIFLEDFSASACLKGDAKPMTKRIIQQYSFYKFKQRLAYLCDKYSCKLILVHPALTTKGCSFCGALQNIKKSETYSCPNCSFTTDRDWNSGKNVLVKGMTILSE
jgi:IS605 OrfB family transposase